MFKGGPQLLFFLKYFATQRKCKTRHDISFKLSYKKKWWEDQEETRKLMCDLASSIKLSWLQIHVIKLVSWCKDGK